MTGTHYIKALLAGSVSAFALATSAFAEDFNIPGGDLRAALSAYAKQARIALIYPVDELKNARTRGVTGNLSAEAALGRVLSGTGFSAHRTEYGSVAVIHDKQEVASDIARAAPLRLAAAAATSGIESVVVTSSKIKGDIQTVPIAITALSQEQLTSRQIAGGPDLVKEVPNLTFSKTNFSGYNIQIRGIGTQAISVTTDPAVAVAFNDTPFLRNHFFEQEFYDVSQVEVLRGPQGTLYGRNATAGVVNVVSAKPTDQFEAMLSADWGNYTNRRYEGMVNIPLVDDRAGLRIAAEWTKRNGYSFNETTNKPIDGRDLWSSRVTLGLKPLPELQAYVVWEHFSENDDRVRSAKQLCKKDPGPSTVDGLDLSTLGAANANFYEAWLSQGCLPTSLYSKDAFETPNGQAIPFVAAGEFIFNGAGGSAPNGFLLNQIDPYADQAQSTNLRDIQSVLSPTYHAKNDVLELNADYDVTPDLTITSQTGYNQDQLHSTEDFNRFDTAPGLFGTLGGPNSLTPGGVYCDPQVGCSDRMTAEDLSQEHAWQFSQELRLASHFQGPFNFSFGANYLRYSTVEDYYVFFNIVTAMVQLADGQGPNDFTTCYPDLGGTPYQINPIPAKTTFLGTNPGVYPANFSCGFGINSQTYIDPNPITNLDGNGHSYFRSENPYNLNSMAGFGEVYYQLAPDLKLTGGLRWTDDKKSFENVPSWTFLIGGGYPIEGIVKQEWKEATGRFNVDWAPKLDFTDQTLVYASYARGYKGGGANPPGPTPNEFSQQSFLTHPATFSPEFVNAYELGTKNTLLDGGMTLNADVFYYDYKGYQISQIVDRTSINLNFDAKVKGLELESTWEPIPGLRFNFAGGLEDGSVNKGQSAIDLMDRTAGQPGWMVMKPFATSTQNCVFPDWVVRELIVHNVATSPITDSQALSGFVYSCDIAYGSSNVQIISSGPDLSGIGVTGFDPSQSPNNGEGFTKNLGGNKLPNTPPFTLSVGAQYTTPVSEDWAATLRGDFYWQGNSFARIFNDRPYDKLRGYSTTNLALILTSANGWQVMGYVKNVFDVTAITGTFLNSDDTALTTNVFLTDPRLYGVRVTKNF